MGGDLKSMLQCGRLQSAVGVRKIFKHESNVMKGPCGFFTGILQIQKNVHTCINIFYLFTY